MNNNSILLIDPKFEPTDSTNLKLLVKIGTDAFSYAIIDNDKKQLYAVYDQQECKNSYERLAEHLKSDSYLKLAYKEISIAAHTENILLVPTDLFDPENILSYTKYFTEAAANNVYVQPALNEQLQTVFSLPLWIEQLISENWPNSTKVAQNTGLLELAHHTKNDTILIDFTVGSFQLIYTRAQQPVFMQTYEFDDIEELTYYLLLIADQLHIDTQKVEVKVCGIIHQGDEKWSRLSQYFNNVDVLVLKTSFNTDILNDMPSHYYTGLLALQQCG